MKFDGCEVEEVEFSKVGELGRFFTDNGTGYTKSGFNSCYDDYGFEPIYVAPDSAVWVKKKKVKKEEPKAEVKNVTTMNSHVEELARQAFVAGLDTDPILYHEIQTFAELLIKECALQACNDYGSPGQFYEGARHAANQIKEHFGITS